MDWSLLKDYISPVISIFTFSAGWLLGRRGRIASDISVWNSYRNELKKFFDEAIDALAEVENLCEEDPELLGKEFRDKRASLISKFSALRDKGKLVIPNDNPDDYGQDKLEAYRGIRHRSLDCIVSAYYCAVALDTEQSGYNKEPIELCTHNIESIPQANKIHRAFIKLPGTHNANGPSYRLERNPHRLGWSCKDIIITCKRDLVSEAQKILVTRQWKEKVRLFLP